MLGYEINMLDETRFIVIDTEELVESEKLDKCEYINSNLDNVFTKLSFLDKNGKETGSALFYYPGRDGWFKAYIAFGYNGVIYLILSDACPKISSTDTNHFVLLHSFDPLKHISKNRFRCIANNDEFPIVKRENEKIKTTVKRIEKKTMNTYKCPEWTTHPKSYYKLSENDIMLMMENDNKLMDECESRLLPL